MSLMETMVVLPVWDLAIPLPAVIMIVVGIYMVILLVVLRFWYCFKDRCFLDCSPCCADCSLCDVCYKWAEVCDCRLLSLRSCLDQLCPHSSCERWDCACTCQPPECETCNCLCFEIKIT
ncbi:hypothetical protein LDENG_00104650 [Lucifuga dentata]|nr:hypothetical protein LDENG_00104650 [Lucifuga dentata]